MGKINLEHKRIVEEGGGLYVASAILDGLVLFNSPKTRSTLSLPQNDLTPQAVRTTIEESDKKFGF